MLSTLHMSGGDLIRRGTVRRRNELSQHRQLIRPALLARLMLALQKRVHDFVVGDKGTAKQAMDKLIEDWTETFEADGKL